MSDTSDTSCHEDTISISRAVSVSVSHCVYLASHSALSYLYCTDKVVKESERAREDMRTLRESSKEIRYARHRVSTYDIV